MVPKSILEEVQGRLGGELFGGFGAFKGILGSPCGGMGRRFGSREGPLCSFRFSLVTFGSLLGVSGIGLALTWGPLGSFWEALGRILGISGCHLGHFLRKVAEPRKTKELLGNPEFRTRLGCTSWGHFGVIKTHPKRDQKREKMPTREQTDGKGAKSEQKYGKKGLSGPGGSSKGGGSPHGGVEFCPPPWGLVRA